MMLQNRKSILLVSLAIVFLMIYQIGRFYSGRTLESDAAKNGSLQSELDASAVNPKLEKEKRKIREEESVQQKINRLKIAVSNQYQEDASRRGLMMELVELYSQTSPEECWEWIKTLDLADPLYSLALRRFAGNVARDHEELWRIAVKESEGATLELLITGGVRGIGVEDASRAWDEFQNHKHLFKDPGPWENSMISSLAMVNPKGAWEVIGPLMDESEEGFERCRLFFSKARFENVKDFTAVIAKMENANLANYACGEFAYSLDREKLNVFLDEIVELDRTDLNVSQLAWIVIDRTFPDNPVRSAELSNRIQDPELKEKTQRQITDFIKQSNPELVEKVGSIMK